MTKLTYQQYHAPQQFNYNTPFPEMPTEVPSREEMDGWSREELEEKRAGARLTLGTAFIQPIPHDTSPEMREAIAQQRYQAVEIITAMDNYWIERVALGAGRDNVGDITGTTHPTDGTSITLENEESKTLRAALDTLGKRYDLMTYIKKVRAIDEILTNERETASKKSRPARTTQIKINLEEAQAKLESMFRPDAEAIVKEKNDSARAADSIALYYLLRSLENRSEAAFFRAQADSVVRYSGLGVQGDMLRAITPDFEKVFRAPTKENFERFRSSVELRTSFDVGEVVEHDETNE